MIPTTPIGTRTLEMRSPLSEVHSRMTSPTGSGRAATSRMPCAMASTRGGFKVRRSIIALERSRLRAVARSFSFAARMVAVRARISSAIASRAAFFCALETWLRRRAAARARRPKSWIRSFRSIGLTTFRSARDPRSREKPCAHILARDHRRDAVEPPAIHDDGRDPGVDRPPDRFQFGNHSAAREPSFVAVGQFFYLIDVAHQRDDPAVLVEQAIDLSENDEQIGAGEGGDFGREPVVVAKT